MYVCVFAGSAGAVIGRSRSVCWAETNYAGRRVEPYVRRVRREGAALLCEEGPDADLVVRRDDEGKGI